MSLLDVPGITPAGLDAAVTALQQDPDSDFRAEQNATYALKTDLPPTSLDGGNASSTYGTSFNFDGGSAA
jgi:hypothetical protein